MSIKIRKKVPRIPGWDIPSRMKMWYGECFDCGYFWQYWDFGATLGAGLEHMRRCRRRKHNEVA